MASIVRLIFTAVLTARALLGASSEQQPFLSTVETQHGPAAHARLSTSWVAVGPYPAGMREQHLGANPAAIFGHPSDVLLARPDAGTNRSSWLPPFTTYANEPPRTDFVSELVLNFTGGTRQKHALSVAFPVSFEDIRQYQGWASLQWQSYLSSELVIDCNNDAREPCPIFIAVQRSAEFAIVSRSASPDTEPSNLEWFTGDWYSYNDGPAPLDNTRDQGSDGIPPQPHILLLATGRYSLLLRVMYEDRIFGDPRDYSSSHQITPIVNLTIDVGHFGAPTTRSLPPGDGTHCSPLSVLNVLAPSLVNGWLAGWGIAVDILNHGPDAITVFGADLKVRGFEDSTFLAHIPIAVQIEPFQTRSVALEVQQSNQLFHTLAQMGTDVQGTVTLRSHDDDRQSYTIESTLRFEVIGLTSTPGTKQQSSFSFTYLTGDGSLGISAATAPAKWAEASPRNNADAPAMLVLHGAGVNALDPAWTSALPRQDHIWTVLPTGGTAWGFDWQLSSSVHARAAVHALSKGAAIFYPGVSHSPHLWDSRIPIAPGGAVRVFEPTKLIVVGHSNGGQGAWHYMTKHPNEVLAGVVAAGYIKLSDYVGHHWHVGRQHADPILNGILRSSLSPFENDLCASNLAGIPLLVKYGEKDTNVPTWHSRSMASLVTAWNQYSLVKPSDFRDLVQVVEAATKGHWWGDIFLEWDVEHFIRHRSRPDSQERWTMPKRDFKKMQLSLTDPAETGSMGIWRVTRVLIPGRLARLTVSQSTPNFYVVNGINVGTVSLEMREAEEIISEGCTGQDVRFHIGGTNFSLTDLVRHAAAENRSSISIGRDNGTWRTLIDTDPDRWSRPMGPMIRALVSSGPLQIVLPSLCTEKICARYRSVGRRFAHDIFLYGRLESRFVLDTDVISSSVATQANIEPGVLDSANVIVLGGPEDNLLAKYMNSSQPRPLQIDRDLVRLEDGTPYFSSCLAFVSLAPHPLFAAKRGLALTAWGNDLCGIETAAKLLPVRTGAQVPEWVVVDGHRSAWQGAGGILATGWYSANWTFSESMSFVS